MKINDNRSIPRTIKEYSKWEISRRNFIKNSLAIGALSQMTLLQSCINNETEKTAILNKNQLHIAVAVQNIIFPKDINGPGAIDFNADKYLLWVLSDRRIPKDEKDYIIKGLKWVDETAQEEESKKFLKLSKKEQVHLIHTISKTGWGESWLSVMLTFVFEAMISDPIYGFNKNEIGRKWLGHVAGYPIPTKENMYDAIFETVANN